LSLQVTNSPVLVMAVTLLPERSTTKARFWLNFVHLPLTL